MRSSSDKPDFDESQHEDAVFACRTPDDRDGLDPHPSARGDIEATLVHGAQGPRSLSVLAATKRRGMNFKPLVGSNSAIGAIRRIGEMKKLIPAIALVAAENLDDPTDQVETAALKPGARAAAQRPQSSPVVSVEPWSGR
jgi:hypothetical protein